MNHNLTILASRFYPDRHGGVETRLNAFARAAAALGVLTDVWSENRTQSAVSEELATNLTVHRQARRHIGRFAQFRPLANVVWWRKRLRANPPRGWIWATDPAMATAVVLAGFKAQLAYNPAGCCGAMRAIGRLHPNVKSMQLSRLWELLDRYAYQHAAKIFVSSQNVAGQFAQRYSECEPNRIAVTSFGVDQPSQAIVREDARRKWGIKPEAFVIGFVGRIDPCKQIDFALEAVANADLTRETRILVVGAGEDEARIKARAQELSLSDNVIWTGNLENPGAAYAAMDVLALPSVYEAFGQVLLEAMAHGVGVIGRRGDGKKVLTACDEIISDGRTGFVVDGHDPADMGRRFAELSGDAGRCHKMGETAREYAAAQTWAGYTGNCLKHLYPDSCWEHEVEYARHRQAA